MGWGLGVLGPSCVSLSVCLFRLLFRPVKTLPRAVMQYFLRPAPRMASTFTNYSRQQVRYMHRRSGLVAVYLQVVLYSTVHVLYSILYMMLQFELRVLSSLLSSHNTCIDLCSGILGPIIHTLVFVERMPFSEKFCCCFICHSKVLFLPIPIQQYNGTLNNVHILDQFFLAVLSFVVKSGLKLVVPSCVYSTVWKSQSSTFRTFHKINIDTAGSMHERRFQSVL